MNGNAARRKRSSSITARSGQGLGCGFECESERATALLRAARLLGSRLLDQGFWIWVSVFRLLGPLLLLQVDGLVLMPRDAGANLGGGPAGSGLLVGIKTFLRAGDALGGVQPLEATA